MNSKFMVFLKTVAVVIFIFGVTLSAIAQSGAGAIHGSVTDPSNAVVAGASVIVTGADGSVASATTSQQGGFDVKGLAAGQYKVEIFAKGFSPFKQEAVVVTAGQIQ